MSDEVELQSDSDHKREEREEIGTLSNVVELFHDVGVYLPTRTIYMGSVAVDADGSESGCDARMAERVIKNLHVLEHINDEPIHVVMNNVGGDEYHGAAIYDAIKCCPCEVTIFVRGHAMSMGSIILQAADVRLMGPNATQMIHYGTWGTVAHAKTAQKLAREGLRWDEWMEQLYLQRVRQKRPDFTLDDLKKLLDHDTFLTTAQSVELGLADGIG